MRSVNHHCVYTVQVAELQLSMASLIYSLIEENGPAELAVVKVCARLPHDMFYCILKFQFWNSKFDFLSVLG